MDVLAVKNLKVYDIIVIIVKCFFVYVCTFYCHFQKSKGTISSGYCRYTAKRPSASVEFWKVSWILSKICLFAENLFLFWVIIAKLSALCPWIVKVGKLVSSNLFKLLDNRCLTYVVGNVMFMQMSALNKWVSSCGLFLRQLTPVSIRSFSGICFWLFIKDYIMDTIYLWHFSLLIVWDICCMS